MFHSLILSMLLLANGSSAADIAGALSSVDVQANSIKSLVNMWSSDKGLEGALSIQDQFPALSKAVGSLSQAAGSATDDAIHPDSVQSLAGSISSLLVALSQKATDFKGVGASDIVANDISSLKQPAVDIINNFAKAVSQNCEKAGSLSPALQNIVQGFSSADANYNLPSANFPSSIACAGNKDANSNPQQNTAPTAPAAGPGAGEENGAGYPSAAPQRPDLPGVGLPNAGSPNAGIGNSLYFPPGGAPSSTGLLGPSLVASSNVYPYANPSIAPLNNNTVPVAQSNAGDSCHASMIGVAIGILSSLAAILVL